jgi:hypothetical protein
VITTTAKQNGRVQLSSTDVNIPLLAVEAANELDELIEGRTTTLESVSRLADVVKQSFRLGQSFEPRQNFVDSGTVAVFSQAIDESARRKVTTMQELVKQAMEIVRTLESSAPGMNLEGTRDFCIALSSAAAAYQQSIFEMRPLNPLRT